MGRPQQGLSPVVNHLWPHHRSMARLVVSGLRPGEIAEITGYSPGQISRIMQSPLFQAEVNRLEAQADHVAVDVHRDLKALAERAVEVLSENLDPEVSVERELRTKTAFDVLDRTGFGKKGSPSLHLHAHAHAKEVEKMSREELYKDVLDIVEEDAE